MNIARVKKLVDDLQAEMPFIRRLNSKQDYLAALNLVEALIDDLDANALLLDLLVLRINEYEEQWDELKDFNNAVKNTDKGAAVLRMLMDQHGLKVTDFQHEIGGATTVSLIIDEKMPLSLAQRQKLAMRFNIPSADFI